MLYFGITSPLLSHSISNREQPSVGTLLSTHTMAHTLHGFDNVFSLGGSADEIVRWQRKVTLCFSVAVGAVLTALLAAAAADRGVHRILVYTCVVAVLASVGVAAWICSGRRLGATATAVYLYCIGLAVLVFELEARTVLRTGWPALVLIVDFMLVLRIDDGIAAWFVVVVSVVMAVLGVETAVRFGVLDMPGLRGQEERREVLMRIVDCEVLPCATGLVDQLFAAALGMCVFVVDFVATRGFAREVQKEQAVMQRTISTVQEVSRLLAKYDVEGVARMLSEQQRELPALMHETLKQMEANLRNYRPYLPAALFEERDHPSTARLSPAPPGLESGVATVVFTDIRSSTAIWECAPEGMRLGLQIHNTIVRDTFSSYNGYEVKTIGDAFMIAFETTCEAMHFALRTHEHLRTADWPLSLLDAPICANQGPLWGGLTVRIGINTGPVTVEQNTLTARIDYLGHTVNVAARLENICPPGAVAIRSDLWHDECSLCEASTGDTQTLTLKGVSTGISVLFVWPVSLAGRRLSPLRGSSTTRHTDDTSDTRTTSSLHTRTLLHPYADTPATVSMVDVEVPDTSSHRAMSVALSALTVQLDQSGGMLVTLLGNCAFVGWNLTRSAPGHVENAIRFAQRLHRSSWLGGAGLVSGNVQHGDVGSRTQRFVTVLGPAVRRARCLCEEAVREGALCLYEPPQGTAPPSALQEIMLTHRNRAGVYMIVPEARYPLG